VDGICTSAKLACSIPRDQIAATRSCFPQADLFYEVQLEVAAPWQGLSQCFQDFEKSNLQCMSLRYAKGGAVFVCLRDTGDSDLAVLDHALRHHSGVTLQSWTTVIC
jgi:hypothetical protein